MVLDWWKYWNPRTELGEAIDGLDRVLVISRVGQQGAIAFLPNRSVYSDSLIVFPFETYAAFCTLQARPHEIWVRFFGSSMKDDLRYTPSDCFETFPFPLNWDTLPAPEAPSAAGAPQAATPRLRPPAHDTDPPGGARDGELSRLRRPPVRRLDPAHSGGHRAAGGSRASHRARLHCSDLPGVPTALHTSGGTGRRGPGSAAPRRQPAQPDRHAAGRGAAAHPQRPVVSGHRASVAPQRGGHRERHPSHGAAGPTGSGRDPGPHPRQPGGPRRRNRLARGRRQWLRVDFQHPHRTLLPLFKPGAGSAAGSGQGGGGRSAGRVVLRSIGQRFLRRLSPL